jgi:DNA-binding NtrC family response regulator
MKVDDHPESKPPSRVRLLVVDDDPPVLDVLAQLLELVGYSVLTAQSGGAALSLLWLDTTIEMIISDLAMPGMDGIRLIQQAQEHHPQMPAILLTGLADVGAGEAVGHMITGPFAILHKPIDSQQLAARVAALLAGSKQTTPLLSW